MLKSYLNKKRIEAGCDEAGRGCLAGPVFAAAVILPKNYKNELLNDSKKISAKNRYILREQIEKDAIAWAVASLTPKEIDKHNILKSSFMAMHKAVKKLNSIPEYLLIDGNRFIDYPKVNHTCIIKGDAKYMSIAAASILAKTYRDDYMLKIAKKHPEYNWQQNKGYPTKAHRFAISQHGATKYHRMSFTLLPPKIKLTV